MVVLWQNGFIRTTVVVFGEGRCIRAMWLYSGKSGCVRAGVVVFGQIGCFEQKWLYSGKVVAFGQRRLYFVKMVVLR